MKPEKEPTRMVIDQIKLLNSEEKKLKKFISYNKDAKDIVEVHLNEIRNKKDRLYKLCDIMGITAVQMNDIDGEEEPIHNQKIPQPTGRFGSTLINWHADNASY